MIGRGICDDPQASTTREWLVTNGIGGFASGTISGVLTRHYHGMLVAALEPPLGRTLLVSKFDTTAKYQGIRYPLYSNQMIDEATPLAPDGYRYINQFSLDGNTPVWQYAIADAIIEKRIWMPYGINATYVQYRVVRASAPLVLKTSVLVTARDFHANTAVGDFDLTTTPVDDGLKFQAQGEPFYVFAHQSAEIEPVHTWRKDFYLAVEHYRGEDDLDAHLHVAEISRMLREGESLTLLASTTPTVERDPAKAYAIKTEREQTLIAQHQLGEVPGWIQQLVLAADQFIVQRQTPAGEAGHSVIAGYHWFGDWGRDTMISLPGLTLTTGRHREAAAILRTFGQFVDQGMLPNRFPDYGETPEYNTVDATLWYFEAIRQYVASTDDTQLLSELYPALVSIIDWHLKGTRYNIRVDPADNLLTAGEEQVQLTWMDAKVEEWVVTPRSGKAVEINALWYNALRVMADFSRRLDQPAERYDTLADSVQQSFSRFWNETTGYCYDVLDTPAGTDDPQLRPNQLFAVSLPHSPLSATHQRAIVAICARHLYTPHGLRSLAPFEVDYAGVYGGDRRTRDGRYHQGTVWGWLIGPFVAAHLRVYGDKARAREFLTAFEQHLTQHCIGNVAEIFDGDAPFTPRGAIAQAWSVAEILRMWQLTG